VTLYGSGMRGAPPLPDGCSSHFQIGKVLSPGTARARGPEPGVTVTSLFSLLRASDRAQRSLSSRERPTHTETPKLRLSQTQKGRQARANLSQGRERRVVVCTSSKFSREYFGAGASPHAGMPLLKCELPYLLYLQKPHQHPVHEDERQNRRHRDPGRCFEEAFHGWMGTGPFGGTAGWRGPVPFGVAGAINP